MPQEESGRGYPRYYPRVRRRRNYDAVKAAIDASGWRVISGTRNSVAPLFLGVEAGDGERFGLCVYTFTATSTPTKKRPKDEHRLQIKYGDITPETRAQNHAVGFDPLGTDVSLILGAYEDDDPLIGLDPLIYDPLPMGISVEWKEAQIDAIHKSGWHVWERDNISGTVRLDTRTPQGVETIVGFSPDRLGDYIRLERDAQALRLDPALRFRRASTVREPGTKHALEDEFDLSSADILDLIRERPRLGMAVRGGVAERHLELHLEADPAVGSTKPGSGEGPPDVIATMKGGRRVTIECKNASPTTYKDGTPKVETQKTRASKGDPKSRLYAPSQFEVLAACMYGPLGRWEFRFKLSEDLTRHKQHADRLAPIQRIDESWSRSLAEAL